MSRFLQTRFPVQIGYKPKVKLNRILLRLGYKEVQCVQKVAKTLRNSFPQLKPIGRHLFPRFYFGGFAIIAE